MKIFWSIIVFNEATVCLYVFYSSEGDIWNSLRFYISTIPDIFESFYNILAKRQDMNAHKFSNFCCIVTAHSYAQTTPCVFLFPSFVIVEKQKFIAVFYYSDITIWYTVMLLLQRVKHFRGSSGSRNFKPFYHTVSVFLFWFSFNWSVCSVID